LLGGSSISYKPLLVYCSLVVSLLVRSGAVTERQTLITLRGRFARSARCSWSVASAFLLVALLTAAVCTAQKADVTITPASPQNPVSLRDRLVVGLKAISKSDVAFIESVVVRVNSGRLPQRLVDQTFFWARDRAAFASSGGRQRRPIIYFRPAMTLIAARIGVTL
jgi:hypothetical protein